MNRKSIARELIELAESLTDGKSRQAARSMTVKKQLRTKSGKVFEVGSKVNVVEYKDRYPYAVVVEDDSGQRVNIPPVAGHKYLRGFPKPPSMSTLMKWEEDGVAKALDGARVEPDGTSRNGAPSWLIALGMI